MRYIERLLRDEEGQSLIEYAIILSFVTISVVGLFMGAGQDVKGVWAVSNNQLTKANTGAS
jgi:Flp pilus assembly pilin Flp